MIDEMDYECRSCSGLFSGDDVAFIVDGDFCYCQDCDARMNDFGPDQDTGIDSDFVDEDEEDEEDEQDDWF